MLAKISLALRPVRLYCATGSTFCTVTDGGQLEWLMFEVAGPAVARRALIPAVAAATVIVVLVIALRRGR